MPLKVDGRTIQFKRIMSVSLLQTPGTFQLALEEFLRDSYWKATLAVVHLGYCPQDCFVSVSVSSDYSYVSSGLICFVADVDTAGGPVFYRNN